MRESTFDQAYCSFYCDLEWSNEEMNVVRHDDEGVEFVVAFAAIVLEGFEKECGVGFDLEHTATVEGCSGDEVRSVSGGVSGDRHAEIVKRTSAAKAACVLRVCGTAEAVPLSADCLGIGVLLFKSAVYAGVGEIWGVVMKRTRIGYTIYSPGYSYEPPIGECWEYPTIRGAKRKARSLGIGSIIVRDFTHEDRKGRIAGDWWQTQFCWVWNGFGFAKAYPVINTKWVVPDHHWFEHASLSRRRSAKS